MAPERMRSAPLSAKTPRRRARRTGLTSNTTENTGTNDVSRRVMTRVLACAVAVILGSASTGLFSQSQPAPAPNPDVFYHLGPDSMPQDGVPKGEIHGPFTLPSDAYPGTQHTYWVYVPAQYNP